MGPNVKQGNIRISGNDPDIFIPQSNGFSSDLTKNTQDPLPHFTGTHRQMGTAVLMKLDYSVGLLQEKSAGSTCVSHDGHTYAASLSSFFLPTPPSPLLLPTYSFSTQLDAFS